MNIMYIIVNNFLSITNSRDVQDVCDCLEFEFCSRKFRVGRNKIWTDLKIIFTRGVSFPIFVYKAWE